MSEAVCCDCGTTSALRYLGAGVFRCSDTDICKDNQDRAGEAAELLAELKDSVIAELAWGLNREDPLLALIEDSER